MTAREIAAAVGKDYATVSRWVQATSRKMQEVSRKVQEARATSKPADYTLDEACQIIETGMGPAAAGVYRANAEAKPVKAPTMRLPSGAQLNALRHIYPAADLAKRIDYLLGYPLVAVESKVYTPRETPENPVDRALVAAGLNHMGAAARLTPADWDNARRTAIAAGKGVLDRAAARIEAESKQGRLIP